MTNKIEKGLSFEEFLKSDSCKIVWHSYSEITFGDVENAWDFCESQKNAEIEELKLKFKDATKLYTDEIEKLEKENYELKEKNKNLQCALDESTNEDPFRFTSYCQGMIYAYDKEASELKERLEKAVGVIELIDYQFCASFGDAENVRDSINKARAFLKEVRIK